MRFRIDIAYDGSGFHGWATQPGLRTVQGTLEDAIALILRLPEPSRLTCAGRTDTGVHARGQVAHIDLDDVDPAHLARRLRRLLPADLQIKSVSTAAEGFDARFSATERHYIYRICDAPSGPDPLSRASVVWHRKPLDIARMNAAAQHFVGEHDFAAFCRRREGATTVRTLKELHTSTNGSGIIETSVRADAFCHSMVRSLMGALTAVGDGRREPEWAARMLAARIRDAQVLVMPAHGLVLEHVVYPPHELLGFRAEESRRRRTTPAQLPAGSAS